MLAHRRPSAESSADARPVAGLVRTHWVLSVCVVCGHEQPRGENSRATCPGCGAQLRIVSSRRGKRAGWGASGYCTFSERRRAWFSAARAAASPGTP